MDRSDAWRLIERLLVDVLNPLVLLAVAGFAGVGYILTWLAPIGIDAWSALLAASIVFSLGALLWRARRKWRESADAGGYAGPGSLLVGLPVALLLLPAIVALLRDHDPNNIAHLPLHLEYARQLYLGTAPPENGIVPGYPAAFYWLYHALLAAATRLSGQDFYTVMNLVNFTFLASGLMWLAQAMARLRLGKPRTLWFGVALLCVFCSVNLTGSLSWLLDGLDGGFDYRALRDMLLPFADRRLHSVVTKMLGASGMSPGYMTLCAVLALSLAILRDGPSRYRLALISAAGIACLGVMPLLIAFLCFSLLGGLAATALWRGLGDAAEPLRASGLREIVRSLGSKWLCLWLITSLSLSLPLAHYFLSFSASYRDQTTFNLFNAFNWGTVLASQALLLPFFGLHALETLRTRRREDAFLLLAGGIGLLLALGVSLAEANQYKFHYPLAVALTLAGLRFLRSARRSQRWRMRATAALAVFVMLALANGMLGVGYSMERTTHKWGEWRFYGMRVDKVAGNQYEGRLFAWYWIRDHAPIDSVVISLLHRIDRAAVLSERLSYVRTQEVYFLADGLEAHSLRKREVNKFYDAAASADEYAALLASMQAQLPGRALYAVVLDSEVSPAAMEGRGAAQAFRSDEYGVGVWLLNP